MLERGVPWMEGLSPIESLLNAINVLRSQSSLQVVTGGGSLVSHFRSEHQFHAGSHGQSSEMEETRQLSRNKLEYQFQRDLNCGSSTSSLFSAITFI